MDNDVNNGGYPHHGGKLLQVSPSVVAVFGIGFAFVLMTIFHLIYVGWCKNNASSSGGNNTGSRNRARDLQAEETMAASSHSVTDERVSWSRRQFIVTTNYGKVGRIEDECVVCLSQFARGDEVRVLVQCGHIFHVSCIDMWLFSHSTCPICRVNTVSGIR